MKFRVWDDENETREDAIEIEASRASEAAHEWATRQPYQIFDGETATACVENENGHVTRYLVAAEIDYAYHVERIEE